MLFKITIFPYCFCTPDPVVEQFSLYHSLFLLLKKYDVSSICIHLIKILQVAAAAKSFQSCLPLCTPWMAAHQAPLSLGFSRQEHWSGLPFPPPMQESEK